MSVRTLESSPQCPRDQTLLVKLQHESVVLDRCPACAGTWFDAKELRVVTKDKELERFAQRIREFAEPSGFACPRCGGACVQSFVEEVVVDTCTLCHGVWMDAREVDESKRLLGATRALSGAGLGFRGFLSRL